MSFLDSSTSIIKAILTARGRQLMAENPAAFKITKFSVTDDEIDYGLTETQIQQLSMIEPITVENALQYKCITMPKGTTKIGILQLSSDEIVISGTGAQDVVVSTVNFVDDNGYTVFIDTLDLKIAAVDQVTEQLAQVVTSTSNQNSQSLVCKTTFRVTGTNQSGTNVYNVRVVGNNSGASVKLKVTVNYIDYTQFNQ